MTRWAATCAVLLLLAGGASADEPAPPDASAAAGSDVPPAGRTADAPADADTTGTPAAPEARLAKLEQENARLRAALAGAGAPWYWLVIGFVGQVVFGLRFVVQWIATELRRRSVVPVAFWYLSLAGTIVLLSYAIYRVDPVFIAGFSLNMIIYLRNLYFIHRPGGAQAEAASQSEIRNPTSAI